MGSMLEKTWLKWVFDYNLPLKKKGKGAHIFHLRATLCQKLKKHNSVNAYMALRSLQATPRHYDVGGRLLGVGTIGLRMIDLDRDALKVAHSVVLQHMTCITPYIEQQQKNSTRNTSREKQQNGIKVSHKRRVLSYWLKDIVTENLGQPNVDKMVERLGEGPRCVVRSYQGYDINGYTFYTEMQDEKSTMQNSEVTVIASTMEFDRSNHNAMATNAKNSFYGVIQEIWELDYNTFTIPLFKCKWVTNNTRATQVFYVKDPSKSRWHIVLHGKRSILGVENVVDEDEYDQLDELPPFCDGVPPVDDDIVETTYLRSDHNEGLWVEYRSVDSQVYSLLDALVLLSLGVSFESCTLFSFFKETWNIPNDNAKSTQLRIANDLFRKFKNNLVTNYVKKNKLPFEDYKFLDDRDWEDFVASKKSKVFLEKSAKAKASANQNKDPARVGRSGYIGKEAQWEEDMAELIKEYPDLEGLQCVRSVKHVLGRLVPNKETGKKELTEAHRLRLKQLARKEHEMIADGTIHIAGQDPLTRVMGPDHPGRTRAKSSVVGKKKGLGNAGERKRKVVIDDYDAFVNKVTLNVLAAIPTLQQESRTSQQPQSICASGVPFDEINEIEVTLYM
ncbi:hypothetical protein Tco_1291622 [Tanacetum coccineum]